MLEFQVREGAAGEIAKITERGCWRRCTTTKTLNFGEPQSRSRTSVIFRSGNWLLRVKISDVRMHNGIRWLPMKWQVIDFDSPEDDWSCLSSCPLHGHRP